ncbi:hypothetical protein LIER_22340 [Lithospermum erythrorhizon]|uniref:Uncharacterized protein n=1 Tax=Lithospermum erythrorhizon TaxID=34254 RepID=A0AAV3QTQ0_LITER
MLVNIGSSTDMIYLSAFDKLHLPRSIIEPMRTPLIRLTRHSVYPLGVASLETHPNSDKSYIILSSPETEVPKGGGIGKMSGDQKRARLCYQASVPPANPGATNQESRIKAQKER